MLSSARKVGTHTAGVAQNAALSRGGRVMDLMHAGSMSNPMRRLPAYGGRGSPSCTPSPSSGAKRLMMSGQPWSTHADTKGSSASSSRVSRNARHALGRTKTRSWRRVISLLRSKCELTHALLNVSGLGAAVSPLAQRIALVAALATLFQQHVQLIGKTALVVTIT